MLAFTPVIQPSHLGHSFVAVPGSTILGPVTLLFMLFHPCLLLEYNIFRSIQRSLTSPVGCKPLFHILPWLQCANGTLISTIII
ncbi:uncharacterized protein BDW70DRAFT_11389 [Aspergillus foveolatus]|uniref:uncharacterized protein n=1 Tax=Aspergillus foveolatus TaxID=210207 RepID=UPI003CCCE979